MVRRPSKLNANLPVKENYDYIGPITTFPYTNTSNKWQIIVGAFLTLGGGAGQITGRFILIQIVDSQTAVAVDSYEINVFQGSGGQPTTWAVPEYFGLPRKMLVPPQAIVRITGSITQSVTLISCRTLTDALLAHL